MVVCELLVELAALAVEHRLWECVSFSSCGSLA